MKIDYNEIIHLQMGRYVVKKRSPVFFLFLLHEKFSTDVYLLGCTFGKLSKRVFYNGKHYELTKLLKYTPENKTMNVEYHKALELE